jgi:uncharacterized membrane protein YcaP (DUF421 family)
MSDAFRQQLIGIQWHEMFVPSYSLLEVMLRGTIIYLAIFFMLRVARSRHAGQMGLADIVVIVLIADAVSNGMAVEYKSIPEGLLLAGTVFFWSFALDWLGYHVPALRPLIQSGPRCLIRNGVPQKDAMRYELLTRDDLTGMLRERGIEDCSDVKRAYIEGDGALSVICYRKDEPRPFPAKKKVL